MPLPAGSGRADEQEEVGNPARRVAEAEVGLAERGLAAEIDGGRIQQAVACRFGVTGTDLGGFQRETEAHVAAQAERQVADDALGAKKKAAGDATTLTQLDAMKIQIASIRQQYIKALMVPVDPQEKIATTSRSSLGYSVKLKSEEDIDKYVAEIKDKLMELLEGNDVLHII